MPPLGRSSRTAASSAPHLATSRLGQASPDPHSCQTWPGLPRRPAAGRGRSPHGRGRREEDGRGEPSLLSDAPAEAQSPRGAAGPSCAACCHLVGRGPRCPPPARRRERAATGGGGAVSLRVPSAPLRRDRGGSAGVPPSPPAPALTHNQ